MMRVAVVQFCAEDDLAANLSVAEKWARAAIADGAQFIALPENFSLIEQTDERYLERSVEESAHPALQVFGKLAREHAVSILLGSLTVQADRHHVHNRSLLLDPTGEVVARYNKIHLFDVQLADGEGYRESNVVAPGEEAVVAALGEAQIGMSICYDLRFPYLYRALAQSGASVITAPAAFTQTTGEAHWHTLVRARAIETGCFVIAPNQCGVRHWGRATYGHSLIVDPWGRVLVDAGPEPGYHVVTIDLGEVNRARSMVPSLQHDRTFTGP